MGSQLLASKIVIQEETPQLRTITGVQTSIAGFLGVTEKGPVGVATLVTGTDQYNSIFGGYVAAGEVRQAVDGFFANGGSEAIVVRTVHYTDPTSTVTKTSMAATVAAPNATPVATLTINGKYDGTYANACSVIIAAATDGISAHFNLQVVKGGLTIETFPNLTMDSTDAHYAPLVVNDSNVGSRYVSLVDLLVAGSIANARPANATLQLTGGNDGLVGITDTDFVGQTSNTGKTGLRCFDLVHPDLLAAPGRATPAFQTALLTYCETTRSGSMFALLDPPAALSGQDVITYYQNTAGVIGLSEYGAAFWPRLQVLNPNPSVFGTAPNINVAPSGYVAGAMARVDSASAGGVYQPAAGVETGVLLNVLGFETNDCLQEAVRDLVYPQLINPITAPKGGQPYIDGTKCLKSTGNFPTIGERRGAIYIEQSVKLGLQFARHQNNTEALRATCARSVTTFLNLQMSYGAFRSTDPATAYFVDFSDTLNPVAVQFQGQMIGRIGLAFNKPAEFIILRFSQDTRAFQNATASAVP